MKQAPPVFDIIFGGSATLIVNYETTSYLIRMVLQFFSVKGSQGLILNKSLLMLFAPKFKEFGCDVAREYIKRNGGGIVHGLCTGPLSVKQSVGNLLHDMRGSLFHLESEESNWLMQECSPHDLIKIEEELGVGSVGRIITADRRVGRGFVRGGTCRPDALANHIGGRVEVNPQRYIVGLYKFLDKLLNTAKPDMVFVYAVAGAPALMLAEMALARKIPFARPTPARIENRMVVDNDPRGLLSSVKRLYIQEKNELEEKYDEAKAYLEKFRTIPEPPEYMAHNHAILQSNRPVKATIKSLVITVKVLLNTLRGRRSGPKELHRIWWSTICVWRREFSLRTFRNSSLGKSEFVYYPLHVDPEASTQVLSPYHTDQLVVIETLAKSVPGDMIVVVKEHAPMVGKRPKGFYKQIRSMPRVVLLGPEYLGLDLVQKAAITAVLTGTAAWEAILLGKPALIIGDSPFLAIGSGAVYEQNLTKLTEAMNRALKLSPASDEELIRYISALLVESFEMNSSLMWGDYLKHKEVQRKKAVSDMVDGILRRESEQQNHPSADY